MKDQDLRPVVQNWPYEPGKITVRTITGKDGREKVQMRLDLGLLQMEMDGRPDGLRPESHESLMQYHQERLAKYEERNGTDLGFQLTGDECQALRDETLMYYHRYLSLFVLEDYQRVERDSARNLQVLDLCAKYAEHEWDRLVLEQYRPYIVMMNTRAKTLLAMESSMYKSALAHVEAGLRMIREFFERFNRPEAYEESSEVRVLLELRHDIVQRLPIGTVERLERKLQRALREERYEDAARIRDQIRAIRDDAETEA
ncbi:MAG: UvrB/UvrC motif-containing protein [Phycisphaerae bacterium]|nr:UvrB/UvrC motif-containing protein [Phycisphaerae bacterium]